MTSISRLPWRIQKMRDDIERREAEALAFDEERRFLEEQREHKRRAKHRVVELRRLRSMSEAGREFALRGL